MTRPPLPVVGPTGSKVVDLSINAESGDEMHHIMQPSPPERDVYDYDDDGPYFVRTMTDEEFAAAEAAYEKASTEWYRTGGALMVSGPVTVTARVTCEDGCKADGVWTGEAWHWTNWTESFAAPKPRKKRA